MKERTQSKQAIGGRRVQVFLAVLVLAFALTLILVRSVRGRWEVPQVVVPVADPTPSPTATVTATTEGGATATPAVAPTPTSTPTIPAVPLPEEARVPILMYHYVSELPPDADVYRRDLTISPEAFRAQLDYLSEAGYHPVTLTDVYLYLTEGMPLPEKPIVLTFDDGYRDAYEVVFPTLLEYGFTGTFFVLATPAHYRWDQYVTWEQLAEMSAAGMDIQAHGRDHVDLRNRSYDFLVYQILGIQEAIEHHTGIKPRFFCYPSGARDADVIAVLKSAGYWGAVTTDYGRVQSLGDVYEMPRIRIHGDTTLEGLISILEDDGA